MIQNIEIAKNIDIYHITNFLESKKINESIAKKDRFTGRKQSLIDHSLSAVEVFNEIDKAKDIIAKISSLIEDMDYKLKKEDVELRQQDALFIIKALRTAIFYHDLGKAHKIFQDKINDVKDSSFDHGIISAVWILDILFFNINKEYVKVDRKKKRFMQFITSVLCMIVASHHNDIASCSNKDLKRFIENLCSKNNNFFESNFLGYPTFNEIRLTEIEEDDTNHIKLLKIDAKSNNILNLIKNLQDITFNSENMFLLMKYLQSCIIVSDSIASYSFSNLHSIRDCIGSAFQNEGLVGFVNAITKDNIHIENEKDKPLNDYKRSIDYYRKEMNKEAKKNFIEDPDKCIYSLSMPTGSGKTFTSLDIVAEMVKLNGIKKVVYTFPFNAIVDQTEDSIRKMFEFAKEEDIVSIKNSMSEIKLKSDKHYKNDFSLMYDDFLGNPLLLTTHVSIFSSLFGFERSACFGFLNLDNTAFVFDEVQAYNIHTWKPFIRTLNRFCRLNNSKAIIMSATNPNLLNFDTSASYKNLVDSKMPDIFKNRVKISLLKNILTVKKEEGEKMKSLDDLMDKVLEENENRKKLFDKNINNKILIELITRKTARLAKKIMEERLIKIEKAEGIKPNIKVYHIDSNTPKYIKKQIIELCKQENDYDMVVFSTQTIEAGVDIDMDIGFKNISTLDSEEQFLGRINRSATKEHCFGFFFKIDDVSKILDNQSLKIKSGDITQQKIFEMLEKKQFEEYFETITSNLDTSGALEKAIYKASFEKLRETFTLIEDKSIVFYIPEKLYKPDIDGYMIWKKARGLLEQKMGFAKKKIELKKLQEKISYFTYSFYYNNEVFEILERLTFQNTLQKLNGIYCLTYKDEPAGIESPYLKYVINEKVFNEDELIKQLKNM